MTKINFYEFIYVWFKLQNQSVPRHQRKIAKWLSSLWLNQDERQGLLMAFRNSGKSTVVGLFCAWVLYRENSARILVMAADYALAKRWCVMSNALLSNIRLPSILNQPSWINGQPTSLPSTVSWNCVTRLCWLKALALISRDCGRLNYL